MSYPVISIGNLTFGGTGKTPTVAWLAKRLTAMGLKPGILSRGYGGGDQGNDEGKMLAVMLPNIPHVQNPDRVAAGRELIERHSANVAILDDGFQHLRVRRDLNLLLLDATDPFGGGACPPGGRLREPISAAARADLVLLTRADLVSAQEREAVWRRMGKLRSDWPHIELAFVPSAVLDTAKEARLELDAMRGQSVTLLSAIGNPAAFRRTAEAAGLAVHREFRFRDHYVYRREDLEPVFRADAQAKVLTTWKDWVKIAPFAEFRPWVLEVEPKFLQGEDFLQEKLDLLFRSSPAR